MKRSIIYAKLNISRRRTLRFLLFLVVGFSLLSVAASTAKSFLPDYPSRDMLNAWFNVDSEESFATFYSTYALQACALLLFAISHLTKLSQGRFLRHWQLLSLIFVGLSFDEALSFHERAIGPLRDLFHTTGFLYYAWVMPAAIFVAVVLLGYLKFLIALPKTTRRLFLTAGSLFVGGAVVMEMVGGKVLSMHLPEMAYILAVTCEEFLEMLGIVIFLYALLSYLKSQLINIEISFLD